jgi:hypothetical protein
MAWLPVEHTAARSVDLPVAPEQLWGVLTDIVSYPRWRPGLKTVTPLPPTADGPAWRETSGDGTMTFETVRSVPPHLWVTRIADKNLPFGGQWEYAINSAPAGSRLTITEHGEIYNPIFRVVSRFILGYTATIDKYLTALAAELARDQ